MADDPQDTTADPEEAGDDAEEAAVEEPSPSGDAGGEGTGPDVGQDEEGVAEATDHSTQLNESEAPDPLSPGQPRGLDPGKLEDRDSPP